MKRKSFLASLLGSPILLGTAEAQTKPNYSTPPFIIDSHIHYRASDEWEKSFLRIYEKHNAMACVLVGMRDLARGIAFANANPDRVIPYAAIEIDNPAALEDIRRSHGMGFKGLGELFALRDWGYDDPKYNSMWELAQELKMPTAPHTGIHASGKLARMRPSFLASVASNYPDLIIHAAHFGNPWYDEAGESTRRNNNLYFDLSGSSLIKKEQTPACWNEYLWWDAHIGKAHMPKNAMPAFEKILFASDEGPEALPENIRRFNIMLDACKVDAATRAKCYGLTIAGIHGIRPPK